MKESRWCERCTTSTNICFSKEAQRIAKATKISKDQGEQLENAFETHKKIAENRKTARDNICSQVNSKSMDPDYPGKKLL